MKPQDDYRSTINKLRTDKGDPAAVRPPTEAAKQEADGEGEDPNVEQIEHDVNNLLAAAEQQGALKVLEPVAQQAGMSTQDLMRKAQLVPELAGKKPEELSKLLADDPAMLDKVRGGGTGAEGAAEHETETMGGGGPMGPMGEYKGAINKLRAK
jgi:hypothetical protein